MLRSLTFRVERMREAAGANYSTATDLADYLVRKGLPFREAHEIVGRVVRHGIANKRELGEMPLEELRGFSPLIGRRRPCRADRWRPRCAARAVIGGTAPEAVARAARRRPAPRGARAAPVTGPRARGLILALALLALLADGGCGKKGPPVAPSSASRRAIRPLRSRGG